MRIRFCCLLFFILNLVPGLGQTTYIVDSECDLGDVDLADFRCADKDGKCTLRAAIENANKTSKKDKVHFKIPGKGPYEIMLQRNLPKITEPLELDATTQPSYTNANPKIVINGKNIPLVIRRFDEDISPIGFHLTGNSGGSTIKGFVIGGFGFINKNKVPREKWIYYQGAGIFIKTENNIIQSNFIGLQANGSTPFSNVFGIGIYASNNLVGGDKPEHRNIISANWGSGILVYSNNFIKGNFIGTDAGGNCALGIQAGITLVVHSENNIIEQNLISGNILGIDITGDRNYILNNRIGTNIKGTEKIPNQIGIFLNYARENIIGGGNLISGNIIGIKLSSGFPEIYQDNYIWGNLIGTGPAGQQALPNETGIYIHRGNGNIIGGANPERRNVISGNTGAGIKFSESSENTVSGNFIGSDLSGEKALPNSVGIEFFGVSGLPFSLNNMIYENLISGNKGDGVRLDYAEGNSVIGNFIGTAIDGFTPVPNTGNGVYLTQNTFNNCIGSTECDKMNNISFNEENGIFVNSTNSLKAALHKNQILQNNIFGNENLGLFVSKK